MPSDEFNAALCILFGVAVICLTTFSDWPAIYATLVRASAMINERSMGTFDPNSSQFILLILLAFVGAADFSAILFRWFRRHTDRQQQTDRPLPPATPPIVTSPPAMPFPPPLWSTPSPIAPLPLHLVLSAGFNLPAGWVFPTRPPRTQHAPRVTEAIWFSSRYVPITRDNEPPAGSAFLRELEALPGATERRPAPETLAEVSSSTPAVTCGQGPSSLEESPCTDDSSTPGAGPSSWPGAASSSSLSAPAPSSPVTDHTSEASSSAQKPLDHPGQTTRPGSWENSMLRRGRGRGLPAVVRRGRGRGGSSQQHFDSPDNWRKRK